MTFFRKKYSTSLVSNQLYCKLFTLFYIKIKLLWVFLKKIDISIRKGHTCACPSALCPLLHMCSSCGLYIIYKEVVSIHIEYGHAPCIFLLYCLREKLVSQLLPGCTIEFSFSSIHISWLHLPASGKVFG